MKNRTRNLFLALAMLALSTLNSQLSTAFAQGSLTPPGAPAPTMKSLDQIEPRTIVNAANTPGDANDVFVITNSGSYYLSTNLFGVSGKSGIAINANNVTLDLNGFALLGMPNNGSIYGVVIPSARTNVIVRNGTISGWGQVGVSASSGSYNMIFERLNVFANYGGISMNGAGVVRDCNCSKNQNDGIVCNGGGIISGCTANNNGHYGISVVSGTVSGCSVQNNGSDGIYVGPGTASGCFVQGNANSGIYVNMPGSEVIGNTCIGNNTANSINHAGIYINDANNRIEDNHVTASGYAGIQVGVGYANNIIIKNSVIGTNNYLTPGSQVVGPIITNTVSGIITNSNPWANFSF